MDGMSQRSTMQAQPVADAVYSPLGTLLAVTVSCSCEDEMLHKHRKRFQVGLLA